LSQIVPTRMISVPFGFHTPLLLDVERQTVAVAGPGACGPDGQVTIEVTVTQAASGAAAAGQTELPCAGADDLWATTVARESGPTLAPGPARACGVATVRVGEEVTDSLEWCRDLTLHVPVYLPLIITS
ncbi:MAG TPA: hypothetical protein PKD53_25905, partial [Chloroflexaceae bacterium]|nr:hypothetical protein [Chloroflexaceae bacterium]